MEGNGKKQIFPVSSSKQEEVGWTSLHFDQPEIRDFEINPGKVSSKTKRQC